MGGQLYYAIRYDYGSSMHRTQVTPPKKMKVRFFLHQPPGEDSWTDDIPHCLSVTPHLSNRQPVSIFHPAHPHRSQVEPAGFETKAVRRRRNLSVGWVGRISEENGVLKRQLRRRMGGN
ncbi:hypothetical protein AVEN_241629-1, partial [Araneus ventricosus]